MDINEKKFFFSYFFDVLNVFASGFAVSIRSMTGILVDASTACMASGFGFYLWYYHARSIAVAQYEDFGQGLICLTVLIFIAFFKAGIDAFSCGLRDASLFVKMENSSL